MTKIELRDLRASAEAADQNYKAVLSDPTATNAEINRAKKRARKAHEAWLDAAADAMSERSRPVLFQGRPLTAEEAAALAVALKWPAPIAN